MLELIKALILGLVQGATEFIPVSSSGHLVIVPWLFGWETSSLLFDTVLHWGTLLSIVLVFWRDFWNIGLATLSSMIRRSLADPAARLGWYIIVGSVPAAVTGLLFKDFFESLFHSPTAAGAFLFVTATLLIGSEWMMRHAQAARPLTALTWRDTIIIGLAQAVALAPGISRSGSTIAAGLAQGVRRDDAARFSFLLGTPAFLGAGLLQLIDTLAESNQAVAGQLPMLIVGFLASAVSGIFVIRFLLNYLRTRTLYPFAVYCILAGLLVIILSRWM